MKYLLVICCQLLRSDLAGQHLKESVSESESEKDFSHFPNFILTPSHSGFLPGNSCIAQFLLIINEIQIVFDENPTVNMIGVFLDISKGF